MISTALSLNFSGAAGRARIASKRSVGGAQRNPRPWRSVRAAGWVVTIPLPPPAAWTRLGVHRRRCCGCENLAGCKQPTGLPEQWGGSPVLALPPRLARYPRVRGGSAIEQRCSPVIPRALIADSSSKLGPWYARRVGWQRRAKKASYTDGPLTCPCRSTSGAVGIRAPHPR